MSHSGPAIPDSSAVPAWVVTFKHGTKVEVYTVEAWKQAKAIRLASAIRRAAHLRIGEVPPLTTQVFARRTAAVSSAEVQLS